VRPSHFIIALIAIAGWPVHATAAEPRPPVAYFLDHAANPAEAPINLPAGASDVVMAKVRFLMRASWMGGRHCEGCTNDILFTRVRIIEVKRGNAEVDQVFDVRMGLRNDYREFAYPHTPDQRRRDYTVVIYAADDGLHRLASFPISQSQYAEWNEEVRAYERERMKNPGRRE
jgi:hypothetical protein